MTRGFTAYKATYWDGTTTGYGGGNLPVKNVHTLCAGKTLMDEAVHPSFNPVRVGHAGFHLCMLPAQCRRFVPHAHRVWEVHVPDSAAVHVVNAWQLAASKIHVVRELKDDEEIAALSSGTVYGPHGTQVSMWRGRLHSFDGHPSVVSATGTRRWHHLGARHRGGDAPAVEFASGLGFWLQDGAWFRADNKSVVAVME